MGTSFSKHLSFGSILLADIKYTKFANGDIYIGEMNEDNKPHGRGIVIETNGNINIAYWDNYKAAPGNYIFIGRDGDIRVGEIYLKEGKRWTRGVLYNTDGKNINYDEALN
jgi:hypothetical protein